MASEMRLIVKANNDVDILDFLADLEDRKPIKTLQKLLQENNSIRYFVIDHHKKENIFTLLLCNAPFDVNEEGNILMLFVHNDLAIIEGYFRRLMGATDYNDKEKRIAVRQVLHILDYCIHNKEEIEQSQISSTEK